MLSQKSGRDMEENAGNRKPQGIVHEQMHLIAPESPPCHADFVIAMPTAHTPNWNFFFQMSGIGEKVSNLRRCQYVSTSQTARYIYCRAFPVTIMGTKGFVLLYYQKS